MEKPIALVGVQQSNRLLTCFTILNIVAEKNDSFFSEVVALFYASTTSVRTLRLTLEQELQKHMKQKQPVHFILNRLETFIALHVEDINGG